IGIEVFGRSSSYDPSEDATVRVKAGEVRKRLGLYYAGEGLLNPLRIDLPAGTYVPEFRRADAAVHPASKPPDAPVFTVPVPAADIRPIETPSRRRPMLLLALSGCVLVVAIAAAAIWLWS